MDPDGNVHRNPLKRPRQDSLDDASQTAGSGFSNPLTPMAPPASKSYILGGNHIKNNGILNLNFYPRSSPPPTGPSSSQFNMHTTANAIHSSSTVENQTVHTPVTSTSHLRSLRRDLHPSTLAHYKYHAEGEESQLLRRVTCTPGTRVRIIGAVDTWAKDTSTNAESLYWLFGSAGSGKSTIAHTLATQIDSPTAPTTLGGNFFCSRQFESTRYSKRIIPTLAYQLAQQCPSFAEALTKCDFDIIHQSPRAQLEEFLANPWLQSMEARSPNPYSPASYLVIIDALDEIERDGGTDLLRSLLDMINEQQLPGLKFFVTSRPNPAIVRHVESFENKKIYRLEEIPIDEADADIEIYLNITLPHFRGTDLMRKLVQLAAGLFIFAATIVKHLTTRHPGPREQRIVLKKLISMSDTPSISASPTQALDQLYNQVLVEAFAGLDEEVFASRLRIVHTFLCAAEPSSAAVISHFLPDHDEGGDGDPGSEGDSVFGLRAVAEDVVQRLYSVLYVQNGKVLCYHRSFTDFIFDQARSGIFWCRHSAHHRLLATSSIQVLTNGLRFNITNIMSSYVFDKNNDTVQHEAQVAKYIPPHLRYACRHWAHHLERSGQHDDDDSLLPSLAKFIHLPALFWIEAMNILGCVALCDAMLQVAFDFIPPGNVALKQAFGEAGNFALYFSSSPASLSTPHLYISALATWNRPAYPVTAWKSQFPGIPHFTSTDSRSASLMKIEVDATVTAVAISTDGRMIAGGLQDGRVKIWDWSVGGILQVFNWSSCHQARRRDEPDAFGSGLFTAVTSVAFFRRDTCIMVTYLDQTIRLWEVETARELQVFQGSVECACMSPDERWIVSGSWTGPIRLWDAGTGDLVRVLDGHTSNVLSVSYTDSPTPRICSGSRDGTVRVWDAESGRVLPNGVFDAHQDVLCVAFSPGGQSVVSISKTGEMWSWDLVTLASKSFPGDAGTVRAGALSCDGSKALLGSTQGLQIRDSSTGAVVSVLGDGTHSVSACTLSVDGKLAVAALFGDSDTAINVWAAVNPPKAYTPERDLKNKRRQERHCLAVSHGGGKIVSASEYGEMKLWDSKTGDLLLEKQPGSQTVRSLAFSEDDRAILYVSENNTLNLLDASTGRALGKTQIPCEVGMTTTRGAISHDGSKLVYNLVGLQRPAVVCVWDISTKQLVQTLEIGPEGSSLQAVALSQDGAYTAAGLDGSLGIYVWETLSGRLIRVLHSGLGVRWSTTELITFSCNCSQIAFASGASVYLWDMAAGNCVRVLEGQTDRVESIAFSPDDTLLAAGLKDRTVGLWDTGTGKKAQEALRGHTSTVSMVVFSPDGRRVISCSYEGDVRVWDITTKTAPYRVERLFDDSTQKSRPTGWLLDRDGDNLLICLPFDNVVPDPSNILVMPRSTDPSLSYSYDTLGDNWQSCYVNYSSLFETTKTS